MKSDLIGRTEQAVTNNNYRYLGIHPETGVVVLFTWPGCGTCVHLPDEYSGVYWVGLYTEFWDENQFEYLRGKITLDNYPESV